MNNPIVTEPCGTIAWYVGFVPSSSRLLTGRCSLFTVEKAIKFPEYTAIVVMIKNQKHAVNSRDGLNFGGCSLPGINEKTVLVPMHFIVGFLINIPAFVQLSHPLPWFTIFPKQCSILTGLIGILRMVWCFSAIEMLSRNVETRAARIIVAIIEYLNFPNKHS